MSGRWRGSVLLAVLAIGCGAADRPQLAPLTGTVTYNGKPLESGMIIFTPDKGRAASGRVRAGEIVDVGTFEPNDGAPVGNLKITVMDAPPQGMEEKKESIVPAKYNSFETSELSVGVYAGKPNTVTVELTD